MSTLLIWIELKVPQNRRREEGKQVGETNRHSATAAAENVLDQYLNKLEVNCDSLL